jgi:hypothetical protein
MKTCLKMSSLEATYSPARSSMQPQRSRACFTNIRIGRRKRVTNHYSLLTVQNISNRHKHGLEIDVTPCPINENVVSNRHRFEGVEFALRAHLAPLSSEISCLAVPPLSQSPGPQQL